MMQNITWKAAVFFLFCCALNLSAQTIQETGKLNYKDIKDFRKEWKITCDSPAAAKGRWIVTNSGKENGWVLRSGKTRSSAMPLQHVVFQKDGKPSYFNVTGAGAEHAFKAGMDFRIMSTWGRPIEKIATYIGAVSKDGKQAYAAAYYTNSGKDVFKKNSLRIDKIDFTTGKVKNIFYKETNIVLDPKKWYHFGFTMTRQATAERAPVILTVTLSELQNGKRDAAKGNILKTFSTKAVPNLGPEVQLGMTEPATVYSVYLANISAEAKAPEKTVESKKKAVIKHTDSAKRWKRYFMDRRNEYKSLSGSVVLAENGSAKAVIVIPENAPAPVRYAAQELKQHLDRMTGAKFTISTKVPSGKIAIYLGNCGNEKPDLSDVARDGYKIKVNDKRILIAGTDDSTAKSERLFQFMTPAYRKLQRQMAWGDPLWDFERGTLYGVYRFLEHLGVRWYMPGETGTVIPEKKILKVSAFEMLEEPVFDMRYCSSIWNPPNVKNGPVLPEEYKKNYAALQWSGAKFMQWKLRMRCSTNYYPINHHPPRFQFEERFGKTHPEYFALYNGKRSLQINFKGARTGALCYSDPGLYQEIMKDADAFFSGKNGKERGLLYTNTAAYGMCYNNGWPYCAAYKNMISLLPHDMYHPCGCSGCAPRLSDRPAGQLSDIVWAFISKAAADIKKLWPDKLVSNLAYATYSHLPYQLDSLPDNVLIGILPCFDKLNEPYILVNPERRKQYFDFTRQWQKMNGMPVIFWTHWLYREFDPRGHYGVPMMMPNHMKALAKESAEYGRIAYMQLDTDNYLFEHLNQYFFYKAHFNPEINPAEMLEEYAKLFYGPAEKEMLELFLDVEKRCTAIASKNAHTNDIWSKTDMFYENAVKHYRNLVNTALQKTKNSAYEKRVLLISEYFVGEMEKGLSLYQKSGSSVKLREKLLKEIEPRKNIDLSKGNEFSYQLMPLVGYPDFQPSEVTVSCKNNMLCIRFNATEQELSNLKRDCKKNFGNIYKDDCFEVMLVPPGTNSYYQILANSNGNYSINHLGKDSGKLIPAEKFKITVNAKLAPEANVWGVDIWIPMSQFPADQQNGIWRFNMFRNRRINKKTAYQASGIYLREHHFHKIDQYLKMKVK